VASIPNKVHQPRRGAVPRTERVAPAPARPFVPRLSPLDSPATVRGVSPMSAQRQRGGRTSRAPVRIEMTRVSHGLRAVCQECICACKAELVACLRSTTRTRVRVCLRGLEDEDYVRDIFGDLLAILKSGEEGTWCYHEGAFVDVSIVPKTPSPPCAQQLSAGSTVYTEQDDGVGSPQGEWERGGLVRRVDDDSDTIFACTQ